MQDAHGVWEFVGSNPVDVGDSDFFCVPGSWHADYFIFTFLMWYISLQWYLVHRTFCRTIFQSTTHAQIENLPSLHHGQQCISNMALIRVLAWGGTGGPCAPPPPSFLPQIVKTCTHKSTIYIHFPNPCYFLLLPEVEKQKNIRQSLNQTALNQSQ